MNINEYKQLTYNILQTIKPEWAEISKPHSSANIVAEALAITLALIETVIIQYKNNQSVNTADFDTLINSYGTMHYTKYQHATSSSIEVKITSKLDTTILTTDTFQDKSNNIWYPDKNYSLMQGENIINLVCSSTGVITINTEEQELLTNNQDIENCIFQKMLTVGNKDETEENYKLRCNYDLMNFGSKRTRLKQALLNNANCKKVKVYITDSEKIDFVEPYSVGVITYGGDSELIFNTISKYSLLTKTCCDNETGQSKIMQVYNEEENKPGNQQMVCYTPAEVYFCYVKIKTQQSIQLTEQILDEIVDNFNINTEIYKTIYASNIITLINNVALKYSLYINITECLISKTGIIDTYHSEITPERINQIFLIKKDNIIIETD